LNEPSKPPDDGLSRRSLFRRGGALAATAGIGAALAGCENTTTPVAANGAGAGGGKGILGDPTAGGPVDSAGIPLARRDYPVVLPKLGDAVASSVKPERGGELQIYNYADYVNPATVKKFEKAFNCKVQVATYNSADEAYAKLSTGSAHFDVVIGLSGSQIVLLQAKQLMQPLNHEYLPNLSKNVWSVLQSPFYDLGARYTIPYVVWSDGIGWRNDKIKTDIAKLDNPWNFFWESPQLKGKVGMLDDYRDGLAMPMQRDAIRLDIVPDLNTEDAAIIEKAGKDLQQLTAELNIRIAITDYQTLPEAKTWLHQSWSGDLLGAAFYYMPKGVSPDVLSYWSPEANGVVQNDFFFVPRNADKPALAHHFINFMLDKTNAYENFIEFVGYTPPQNSIDADVLIRKKLIPESLRRALVRPDQFPRNQELLSLTTEGDRLWENAWSKFKAG
jgi:spermidine/putrescine transport system substrate-binding protein